MSWAISRKASALATAIATWRATSSIIVTDAGGNASGCRVAHGQRPEPAVADDERDGADGLDARLTHRGRRVGEADRVRSSSPKTRVCRAVNDSPAAEPVKRLPTYLRPSPDLVATACTTSSPLSFS